MPKKLDIFCFSRILVGLAIFSVICCGRGDSLRSPTQKNHSNGWIQYQGIKELRISEQRDNIQLNTITYESEAPQESMFFFRHVGRSDADLKLRLDLSGFTEEVCADSTLSSRFVWSEITKEGEVVSQNEVKNQEVVISRQGRTYHLIVMLENEGLCTAFQKSFVVIVDEVISKPVNVLSASGETGEEKPEEGSGVPHSGENSETPPDSQVGKPPQEEVKPPVATPTPSTTPTPAEDPVTPENPDNPPEENQDEDIQNVFLPGDLEKNIELKLCLKGAIEKTSASVEGVGKIEVNSFEPLMLGIAQEAGFWESILARLKSWYDSLFGSQNSGDEALLEKIAGYPFVAKNEKAEEMRAQIIFYSASEKAWQYVDANNIEQGLVADKERAVAQVINLRDEKQMFQVKLSQCKKLFVKPSN